MLDHPSFVPFDRFLLRIADERRGRFDQFDGKWSEDTEAGILTAAATNGYIEHAFRGDSRWMKLTEKGRAHVAKLNKLAEDDALADVDDPDWVPPAQRERDRLQQEARDRVTAKKTAHAEKIESYTANPWYGLI